MNKNIILTLLMAMATVSAWAGDAVLIIKTKTAEYKYLYSQTPHIVPEGQTLTITCGNEAPVTLTFDEVKVLPRPTLLESIRPRWHNDHRYRSTEAYSTSPTPQNP